ncbi:C-terminal binding protein [Amycolatopsis rhabdoformis]|uniref:C-terminal binding protein n=1 Tax=Amycolatopsis rhabdoformis TaxID=1448059 RepID=A0ABZ1IDZ1_9PSEU|nr:C-terminal binding protein [Amycolatopsis rhabdoformis]WSE32482.1 C-terminal binding protein [Amycolatopsis rhabdoformis]
MTARVVMTNTAIPLAAEAEEAFAGLDVGFEMLDAGSPEDLVRITRDADAVITLAEPFTREVLVQLPRCRSVTRFGIGVDNVDLAAATAQGIWVTNVPDANYREVAVHTIALALSVTRKIGFLNRSMHETGHASLALARGTRRPDEQTFGLVGLGRIGRRVATMAQAIGYRVIAADPFTTEESGVELVSFDEVVARSDILSLHVPLTGETRDLVDAGVIERMRDGAVLINVSRGGLVDDAALGRALRAGKLAGAGIDAYVGEPAPLPESSPLRGLEQVLLTPHSAHYSEESFAEIKTKALADVARVLRGERPAYPVNEIPVTESR